MGCPIRTSLDHSLLAAPQGLSQRATSFIASWRQGIHPMPLSCSPLPRPAPTRGRPEPGSGPLSTIHTHSQHPWRTPGPAPPARAPHSALANSRSDPSPARHPRGAPFPIHHTKTTSQALARQPRPAPPQGPDQGSLIPTAAARTQASQHPGDGRSRTGDPLLAKQALSQLSYVPQKQTPKRPRPAPDWWAREDLNLRPHAYQACALTN